MKGEIASVAMDLARWGRWAIRCESGALGFASSCVLGGGDGDRGGYESSIPRGVVDDMEMMDGMVRRLPDEPLPLQRSVIEFYKFGSGKSLRCVAATIGMSDKTLARYLVEAQRKIALDISMQIPQNPLQSASGESCPSSKQPVTA